MTAKTTPASRTKPFVLITGAPGTGKTTLADALAEALAGDVLRIDVGAVCKAHEFYLEYDADMDTHVLDEDALLDYLEDELAKAGDR